MKTFDKTFLAVATSMLFSVAIAYENSNFSKRKVDSFQLLRKRFVKSNKAIVQPPPTVKSKKSKKMKSEKSKEMKSKKSKSEKVKSSKMPKTQKSKSQKSQSKSCKSGKSQKSGKSDKSGKSEKCNTTSKSPTRSPTISQKPSVFPTDLPTLQPSSTPTAFCFSERGRIETITAVAVSISGADVTGTPQVEALKWITNLDPLPNVCDGGEEQTEVSQMYVLAVFYYSTSGDDWNDNSMWVEQNQNVCDWYGIECNSNRNVLGIKLGKLTYVCNEFE